MKYKYKFSVIIPFHNAKDRITRTILSLHAQTFKNFEAIFVDDASTDDAYKNKIKYEFLNSQYRYHQIMEKGERVNARNFGMQTAQGEWICWLDAGDEYISSYLESLDIAIKKFSDFKVFNFGSLLQHDVDCTLAEHKFNDFSYRIISSFKPERKNSGHEEFKSGYITTGGFIFKQELLSQVGYLPISNHPYGDELSFSGKCKNPNYPRNEQGQYPAMGNPWGDDYQMFYMLTRQNWSKPLDLILYIAHLR